MKGLRLFVRQAGAADASALASLLAHGSLSYTTAPESVDFIAKLLGETVATARLQRSGDAAEIASLFVHPELRGKRIATVLVSEISRWGTAQNVTRLTVRRELLPSRFLERAGFRHIDDLFVKDI